MTRQPVVRYRLVADPSGRAGWREVTRSRRGPFYHGGRARLRPGGLIRTGQRTNSWGSRRGRSAEVFFSASFDVARDTARACLRESGRGYLYEVAPTGPALPDTDPDSFRSASPLLVIRCIDLGGGCDR